jgi:hypothetical protein
LFPLKFGQWLGRRPGSLQPHGNPGRGIDYSIAVGILDKPQDRHRIVRSSFETFADEAAAGIRPLASQPCERLQATSEKLGAIVAGRVSARGISF